MPPFQKAKTDIKGTTPSHSPLFSDARSDLGYGTMVSKFHDPRTSASSYPYMEPDIYEDDEVDLLDDDMAVITKANMDYMPTDYLAANGTDPFYFVAGNLKIGEAIATMNGISPIPSLYKKRGVSTGGFTQQAAYDERPAKKTGTLQGYAHRPPDPDFPTHDEIGAYTLQDILDDDEIAIAKVQATQDYINSLASIEPTGKKR